MQTDIPSGRSYAAFQNKSGRPVTVSLQVTYLSQDGSLNIATVERCSRSGLCGDRPEWVQGGSGGYSIKGLISELSPYRKSFSGSATVPAGGGLLLAHGGDFSGDVKIDFTVSGAH